METEYLLVERGHAIRINGELAMSHIRLADTLYKDTLPELINLSLTSEHRPAGRASSRRRKTSSRSVTDSTTGRTTATGRR